MGGAQLAELRQIGPDPVDRAMSGGTFTAEEGVGDADLQPGHERGNGALLAFGLLADQRQPGPDRVERQPVRVPALTEPGGAALGGGRIATDPDGQAGSGGGAGAVRTPS